MKNIILFLTFFILFIIFFKREHFKVCKYNPIPGINGIEQPLKSEIDFMKKCICNEFNLDYFHCNKLLLNHYKNDFFTKVFSNINKNFTDKILEKLNEINLNDKNCNNIINDFGTNAITILTDLNKNIENINIQNDILFFVKRYKYICDEIKSKFPKKFIIKKIPVPSLTKSSITTSNTNKQNKKFPCFSNFNITNYLVQLINNTIIGNIKFVIDSIDTDEKMDTIEIVDDKLLEKILTKYQINKNNISSISSDITESIIKISQIAEKYYCMKSNIEKKNNNCCKKYDCSKKKGNKIFYNMCIEKNKLIKYSKYNC